MAVMTCKKCRSKVDFSNRHCPNCGNKLEKQKPKSSKSWWYLGGFVLLLVLGSAMQGARVGKGSKDGAAANQQAATTNQFGQAQVADVGALSWTVYRSFWSTRVDKPFESPEGGGYLFVELMVQNAQAQEPQTIPNVELIDGNDAIYLPTAEALMLRDALRIGQSLNPFEVKIGVLVFKAPPSGTYKVRIKGGSLPGIGYVALTPKPAPYGKVIE